MNEESDAILIARAKEEPEAFGVLYERYVGKIYNYIYYRTTNHHDAEDLTARTFQRALKHMPRYVDRGAPFSAWLYRIAHNVVANWHRDRSRRQFVPLDDVPLTGPSREDPVVLSEESSQEETLMQAVRRLPPERQQLIILKFVEQMSNAEIGRIMGRTEGAIKSLYHRTLVALREELDHIQDQTMGNKQ
ncbi:MAG: sigma-70 family RNA polymerase sigma factor [Chloroflexi bacterium]|nr:sigma-70 family RNA polymerase sigma factor [Chloroflexota bacterium]